MNATTISRALPLVCSVLFILVGFAFIPEAGIQNDEALFASGIYEQVGIAQGIKILGHRVPLMLNSYLGSFKSWVYAPIFRFWRPSAYSLRVPVLVASGVTIWLFCSLLRRIADSHAAAAGGALLASDALFLVTSCFDWGPVVLDHLLLVSGSLCLVRFHQEKRRGFLATGFLLFGLALWDKFLFAWIFSGMAVATLIVLPRELRNHLKTRNLAIAAASLCLGAAPLLFYNVSFPLHTLRANTAYTSDDLSGKSHLLLSTLKGAGLFGYIPRDNLAAGGRSRQPENAVERFSVRLSEWTGGQRAGYLSYAMLAAMLLFPILWSSPARRPMAFVLVAMTVAWLQMLFAKGGGGSVHHVILLWPFPALFVAVAFAAASQQAGRAGIPLLIIAVLFLAGANSLVTNEYLSLLVRNGGGLEWTDAIYPLSEYLRHVKADTIYLNDWGMFDSLRMLNRGKLPLRVGSDPLSKPQLDADDKQLVLARISEAGSVFVAHPDGQELFPGVNAKLRAMATEAGYRPQMLAIIPDRNARPTFEVFHFQWAGAPARTLPRRQVASGGP